jgi:hypothetical protein
LTTECQCDINIPEIPIAIPIQPSQSQFQYSNPAFLSSIPWSRPSDLLPMMLQATAELSKQQPNPVKVAIRKIHLFLVLLMQIALGFEERRDLHSRMLLPAMSRQWDEKKRTAEDEYFMRR